MISDIRRRLEQLKGRHQVVQTALANAESDLETLRLQHELIEQAAVIIGKVAQVTQTQLVWNITDRVSSAIDVVFPNERYQFGLEFVQRRGRTELDLFMTDSDGNRIRPADSEGGGLVNVVAFALRIAIWALTKDTQPVFILDEPFHYLHSSAAHNRLSELVRAISDELGVQIIIITGEDESPEILAGADAVFRLRKIQGKSIVQVEQK